MHDTIYTDKAACIKVQEIYVSNTQKMEDIKCWTTVKSLSRILAGNKIVDHSDVVGASPVGAAPT